MPPQPRYREDFHGTRKENVGDFKWGLGWTMALVLIIIVAGTPLALWAAGMELPLLNIHRVAVTHSLEYSQTNVANLYDERSQVLSLETKARTDSANAPAYKAQASAVLGNMQREIGSVPGDSVPAEIKQFVAERS